VRDVLFIDKTRPKIDRNLGFGHIFGKSLPHEHIGAGGEFGARDVRGEDHIPGNVRSQKLVLNFLVVISRSDAKQP
jgi:hypothetical protein